LEGQAVIFESKKFRYILLLVGTITVRDGVQREGALDESCLLRRYRQHHVHVIGHQMP